MSEPVITPMTRRMVVASLAIIALASIVGEVALVVMGRDPGEGLLSMGIAAVGAIAGLAVPTSTD